MPRWVLLLIAYVIGSLFPFSKLLGAVKGV